jgi:ketol-acid reductoisomerase
MNIHLVGFGGQGKAWAPSLKEAAFSIQVYLPRDSKTFALCQDLSLPALPIKKLPGALRDGDVVVFGCPDRKIGEVYREFISEFTGSLHLILIHGYAVWSGDIPVNEKAFSAANPKHTLNLLAPKAIGPELRSAIQKSRLEKGRDGFHSLRAGFSVANETARAAVLEIATDGLQFSPDHLIPATFEQETVGDLISEQLLLCGGLFSLMEWTLKEMRAAGIPEALIHEECLTELELVARVLRTKGLAGTLDAISDSAKAGAVMMRKKLVALKLPELLHEQAQEVINKKFLKNLLNDAEWKKDLSTAFGATTAGAATAERPA